MASDDEGARREQLRHQFRAQPVHDSHAWSVHVRSFAGARLCQRCGAHSDTGAGVQPCPRDPIPDVARALREHPSPADPTPLVRGSDGALDDAPLRERHAAEQLRAERWQDAALDQMAADLAVADPPPLVRAAPPTRNGEGTPQRRNGPRLTGFLFTSETIGDSLRVIDAEQRAKSATPGDLDLANAAYHYAQSLRRHIEESGFVSPILPHQQD